MTDHVQGVLDFDSGNPNGYQNWRREQKQRLQAIRTEWRLPLRRRVRVRLKNIDGEFEGILQLLHQPLSIDRRLPLQLRIDTFDFLHSDIEQCVVIEEDRPVIPSP